MRQPSIGKKTQMHHTSPDTGHLNVRFLAWQLKPCLCLVLSRGKAEGAIHTWGWGVNHTPKMSQTPQVRGNLSGRSRLAVWLLENKDKWKQINISQFNQASAYCSSVLLCFSVTGLGSHSKKDCESNNALQFPIIVCLFSRNCIL